MGDQNYDYGAAETGIGAAIEAATRLANIELVDLGDGVHKAAAVPEGKTLQSLKPLLDAYLERPERKTGFSTLTTLDSFIGYCELHKSAGESLVFIDDCNPSAPRMYAFFNAHERTVHLEGGELSTPTVTSLGRPDYQDFGAIYPFPMSPEWRAWTGMPKEFTQAQFADFLEDHIEDVVEAGEGVKAYASGIGATVATPAGLMELSRGLAIHVTAKAAESINPSSGERTLVFSEEHKDGSGAPLKVPGAFAIGIPVFKLGKRYQLPVRVRYRRDAGRVLWSLVVQRADKALDLALTEAGDAAGAQLNRPVFRGVLKT